MRTICVVVAILWSSSLMARNAGVQFTVTIRYPRRVKQTTHRRPSGLKGRYRLPKRAQMGSPNGYMGTTGRMQAKAKKEEAEKKRAKFEELRRRARVAAEERRRQAIVIIKATSARTEVAPGDDMYSKWRREKDLRKDDEFARWQRANGKKVQSRTERDKEKDMQRQSEAMTDILFDHFSGRSRDRRRPSPEDEEEDE